MLVLQFHTSHSPERAGPMQGLHGCAGGGMNEGRGGGRGLVSYQLGAFCFGYDLLWALTLDFHSPETIWRY